MWLRLRHNLKEASCVEEGYTTGVHMRVPARSKGGNTCYFSTKMTKLKKNAKNMIQKLVKTSFNTQIFRDTFVAIFRCWLDLVNIAFCLACQKYY